MSNFIQKFLFQLTVAVWIVAFCFIESRGNAPVAAVRVVVSERSHRPTRNNPIEFEGDGQPRSDGLNVGGSYCFALLFGLAIAQPFLWSIAPPVFLTSL